MTDPEASRLSRWSRRKLEAKRQAEVADEVADTAAVDAVDAVEEDPDLIAALPSLDEIEVGFDMTPFLAKGVPAHLKNAAFRKLWQASPAVRDYLDPAVDYAWDWNAPGGVPGGGGALSEQSVAKMVKGLIGERSDDAEELIAEDTTGEEADPAPETDQPEASPVAVRRDTPSEPEHKEKPDAPRAFDRVAQLPLRRHGGAMPE
ncbi:conserved hypothetical protein [Dinoroseobacter shibae DFL 12 = DSM 16493]|uniref:DUF3306 domain-containing protein n=2 Tax=Dinoroseobacter shibae TaxID=215813 RepID=A8LNU1_DINSH|nr:DUF3306 domain-containing protein [Dinoroseobacter shibae]ABV92249.1 conserved hypothetical protein [Dinoroseobacter shibae DFL 12 = DSM 16493]